MKYLDRFFVTHTFGFHLSSHELRGAHISYSKGEMVIDSLYTIPFIPSESLENKEEGTLLGQNSLPKEIEKWDLATGLSTQDVLIRSLDIKLTKEKEIQSVLAFQAEPILPYPLENGILSHITLGQKEGISFVTLLSVRNDRLLKLLSECQKLKLEPEVVSCDPVALAAFAESFGPKDNRPLCPPYRQEVDNLCSRSSWKAHPSPCIPLRGSRAYIRGQMGPS